MLKVLQMLPFPSPSPLDILMCITNNEKKSIKSSIGNSYLPSEAKENKYFYIKSSFSDMYKRWNAPSKLTSTALTCQQCYSSCSLPLFLAATSHPGKLLTFINQAVRCFHREMLLDFEYLIYKLQIACDIPFLSCNQKTK